MICLGLESSCDETAAALVADGRLLGEKLASQEDLHALFGGVVPELASREHLRRGAVLIKSLMRESGLDMGRIDAVAVARGPGLLGSLLVGLNLAKGLALALGARLVGVNHLHAHLMAPGLNREMPFPCLGLLISGGHTQLYLVRSPFDFELLGRTLDDAAGEALDKAAKLANLPYPGGRHIDELAQAHEPDHSLFPRPYTANDNLDFSFSGLKTALARYVAGKAGLRLPVLPEGRVAPNPELGLYCASVNWAVADTLRIKTERALSAHPRVRALIVAGGVAANTMVRRAMAELAQKAGVELIIPEPGFCTDNAAMIANLGSVLAWEGFSHGLDLAAVPRGCPVPFDYLRDEGLAPRRSFAVDTKLGSQ
jgi:N6-L-threonylcarbamoyladenine synthase